MTKVLIIRLSSIGDIVLTTPVIRHLKTGIPDIELHYIVKNEYASIVQSNPYVDKVWVVRESVLDRIPSLKLENFDFIIDLHHNLRSHKIKSKIKADTTSVNKLNIKKWLWVHTGMDLLSNSHIVDRYLDCIKPFNIAMDYKGLDFFIPKQEEVAVSKSLNIRPNNYIVWVIGATYKGKRLSTDKTIEALKYIDKPIVLMGGKVDVEAAETILSRSEANMVNAVGKYTLNQSASIVKQAAMVVTMDTGMMHIASAFQKDIVSIWGCTTPGLGMSPYKAGPHSVMVEPVGLKRRPCSKLGNHCKYKGGCINRISMKSLATTVLEVYKKNQVE